MISITGQTTVFLLFFITDKSASSHPVVHSQWASRKVKTSPEANLAPFNRALIKPIRDVLLRRCVLTGRVEI